MATVSSFLPESQSDARILILGSMPGIASLEAQRYYAHARNAFWPILSELCGFAVELPYGERLVKLRAAKIALWDVLASCAREGSLDSDIEAASAQENDFAAFFADHEQVRAVFCNGATAHRLFMRRVVPGLRDALRDIVVRKLPSTSPAHASMSLAEKCRVWQAELGPHLR